MEKVITPSKTELWRVAFEPRLSLSVHNIGFIGIGDVVLNKLQPALLANRRLFDGIVACSIESKEEAECRLKGTDITYIRLRDSILPMDQLGELGFLARTLWFVATPSLHHVEYAIQLARHSRVAVEKPIAANAQQARMLLPLADSPFEIFPVDHKLFNLSPLDFVDRCRRDPVILDRVHHIQGVFYEAAGFAPGRKQDDCIADVQWHLYTVMLAPWLAIDPSLQVNVEEVQVTKYEPEPPLHYALPIVWTASRIRGHMFWKHEITYDFLQAKGAPTSEKVVRLFDSQRSLIKKIDLSESGWEAHGRIIKELLRPRPDMRHTLAHAVAVMELVDLAKCMAIERPGYTFGELPLFLKEE